MIGAETTRKERRLLEKGDLQKESIKQSWAEKGDDHMPALRLPGQLLEKERIEKETS